MKQQQTPQRKYFLNIFPNYLNFILSRISLFILYFGYLQRTNNQVLGIKIPVKFFIIL